MTDVRTDSHRVVLLAGFFVIAIGLVGLGVAVDYLQKVGLDKIRRHEKQITQYALSRLQEMIEVKIYGPLDVEKRGGLVAFTAAADDLVPNDANETNDVFVRSPNGDPAELISVATAGSQPGHSGNGPSAGPAISANGCVVAFYSDASNLVTGDTKVVDKGKGDGIYVNTSGVGRVRDGVSVGPGRAAVGDAVIVSGPIGDHGIAVMAAREGIDFETALVNDLRRVLRRTSRGPQHIAIGTATDAYQPAERRFGLTRRVMSSSFTRTKGVCCMAV